MPDDAAHHAPRVFVALGSNIDPEANLRRALLALRRRARLVALSTVYATDPVGPAGQPPFLNAVVEVATDAPPWAFKREVLRAIERELGRERGPDRYAPRTIDLDLILYGESVVDQPGLRIPDPAIVERDFVAVPLCEVAPDLLLPGSRRPLCEVAAAFAGHAMRACPAYTAALRRELGLA